MSSGRIDVARALRALSDDVGARLTPRRGQIAFRCLRPHSPRGQTGFLSTPSWAPFELKRKRVELPTLGLVKKQRSTLAGMSRSGEMQSHRCAAQPRTNTVAKREARATSIPARVDRCFLTAGGRELQFDSPRRCCRNCWNSRAIVSADGRSSPSSPSCSTCSASIRSTSSAISGLAATARPICSS